MLLEMTIVCVDCSLTMYIFLVIFVDGSASNVEFS